MIQIRLPMQSMADPTIYSIKGWGVYDTVSDVVHMYVQFCQRKSLKKKLIQIRLAFAVQG